MNGDMDRGFGVVMTGVFIGAVVGAGLALMLAPAPGPETRRRLAETARRVADGLNDVVETTKSKLGRGQKEQYEPVGTGTWEATAKSGY